jgi:hypothetical protein
LQCGFDPNPIITDIGRDTGNQAGHGDIENLANLQDLGHGGVGHAALESRDGLAFDL